MDTLSTVRRAAADHWERQDPVVTLSAVPDAHFVGQRVVIYPDVHGVVRALRDGKLTVEADSTGTVHEVGPGAILLEERNSVAADVDALHVVAGGRTRA